MMNRVEMNEEMMAQVNGGKDILDYINDAIHFDPMDVLFPETPEEKKARRETRNNIFKEIKDLIA